jgi:hypothetical protein
MTQIHASIKAFVHGIAKKVVQFVVVDAKSVVRLKGRWSDGNDGMELSSDYLGWYAGFLFKREINGIKPYPDSIEQNS